MRRARGIQSSKISVSVSKVDLQNLKQRAKRLHGGNISAVVHEMAEQAAKQEAIDRLWQELGQPTVSDADWTAIVAEWAR
jgi:hypothetical protein